MYAVCEVGVIVIVLERIFIAVICFNLCRSALHSCQ